MSDKGARREIQILLGGVTGGVEVKIIKEITGLIKILSLPLRTINKCDMII